MVRPVAPLRLTPLPAAPPAPPIAESWLLDASDSSRSSVCCWGADTGCGQVVSYPGRDPVGCLAGSEQAGVVAGLDVRPEPGGEALVFRDRCLGGGAAPGRAAAEPAGQDGVGAVE